MPSFPQVKPPSFSLRLLLAAGFLFSRPALASLPEQIDDIVTRYSLEKNIPGVVVGVWRQGSEITVIEKGFSDLENATPVSRYDHFRIASVTKSFTVTRILQLAQHGHLSLDDPISKYVPGLHNGHATLRELANMTSGIFNYTEDEEFVQEFFSDLTKTWTDQQLVDIANVHNPYFPPGTAWHYSNTNTILLGMVVEQVTGNSLASELETHVFTPAGLSLNTLYPQTDTIPPPFSHGYVDIGEETYRDVTLASPTSTSGSGALISTIDDLAIWSKILAQGTLLSPEMQDERLQMVSTAGGEGPYYDAYGLGIGTIEGWLGHTGDFVGFQSLVMHDVLHDQTVVILLNLSGSGHLPTEMFLEIAPLLSIPEPSTAALALVLTFLLFALRSSIKKSGLNT